MKCLGKKILQQRRAEKICRDTANMFLNFVDMSTGYTLHNTYGFGKDRISKFFVHSYKMLSKYIQKYGDDRSDDREDVNMALLALKRELGMLSFDCDSHKQEALKRREDYWSGREHDKSSRDKRKWRELFIDFADMPFDCYYYSTLVYMHDTYGFGKDRMAKLYNELMDNYNLFVSNYLACTFNGDMTCEDMIDFCVKALRDVGVIETESNNKGE